MKQYILSILGVILIGCLIDIILPSGKMNNYIKSMFAIFVLATIISPITKIIKNSSTYLSNTNNILSTNADILYEDMINSWPDIRSISTDFSRQVFKNKCKILESGDSIVIDEVTKEYKTKSNDKLSDSYAEWTDRNYKDGDRN